jgi:hypothetical protein
MEFVIPLSNLLKTKLSLHICPMIIILVCHKKTVRAKQLYVVLPMFETFFSDLVDMWMVIFFNKILVIFDFSGPYERFYADYNFCDDNYC